MSNMDRSIDEVARDRARVIHGHVSSNESMYQVSSTAYNGSDQQTLNRVSQIAQAESRPNSTVAKDGGKKKKGSWLDSLNMDPKAHWPKKYRYTIEPAPGSTPILSIRERDHFEANGFIIIKNLIPKQGFEKLANGESMDQFVTHPNVVKFVQQFTGPNIMAMSFSRWTAPEGSQTNLVQDLFSLPFRPADRILRTFTLLPTSGSKTDGSKTDGSKTDGPKTDGSKTEDSSVNIILIPGSHRTSQMMTIEGDEKVIHEVCPRLDLGLKKQVNLIPGDTVFYHPLLAHSFVKEGNGQREAISCTFASSECEYVSTSGTDSLPQLNVQLERNQNGIQEWMRKALLIKGNRINL